MKLLPIVRPSDKHFVTALSRIMRFAVTESGCNISPDFFAASVSRLYMENSPLMLLMLILDDVDCDRGHFLGIVERSYGRLLGFCYQLKLDNEIPLGERLRLIRDGKAIVEEWARRNGCCALAMATQRNLPAMARRFGFTPTHTLMESPLEDVR